MLVSSFSYILSFDAKGFEKARTQLMSEQIQRPLHIVITGASRGIGKAAADYFRTQGHRVTALARSSEPSLDTGDFDAIRAFANAQGKESIDVLIHNAGAMLKSYASSQGGIEATWAHHVAGPFLLTELLLKRGALKPGGRVIFQTSGGLYLKKIDIAAPYARPNNYNKYSAYANAKRAQLMLTHLWQQKYPSYYFSCTHPGWVKTQGVRKAMPLFNWLMNNRLRTPEQGAKGIEMLALTPEPLKGFWFDGKKAPDHLFNWTKESEDAQAMLYERLSQLL